MMLLDQLNKYNLVLASQSPRRQQLLKGMDIAFQVLVKDVDESFPPEMPFAEIASFLSVQKSKAYTDDELPENYLLITADTIVISNGIVLNKPGNEDEAKEMLGQLSGRTHKVITGVCLRSDLKSVSFSEISEVSFGRLTAAEIDYYITNYKPFDKAGAYGIQEWIGYMAIRSVKGSFYNVMGLPTHQLYQALKAF